MPKILKEIKRMKFEIKHKALICVLAIAVVCMCIGCTILILQYVSLGQKKAEQAEIDFPSVQETEYIVKNPINFAAWQARNADIYAWIAYDNTAINFPILQSATEMEYYLDHDMDGNYSEFGEIFTQSLNVKDFTDPVTVVYGHNIKKTDIMFSDLHKLEDLEFFQKNPQFTIYLPDKILTYEIVSVYEGDNQLIPAVYDFHNEAVQQEYFDSILDPDGKIAVREDATLVAGQDKIVQLSTCTIPSNAAKRFLVTGKLVNEQKTK